MLKKGEKMLHRVIKIVEFILKLIRMLGVKVHRKVKYGEQ